MSTGARITDVTLKSISTNVESIVNSLGYQINTSDALAKEWKENISTLDSFIKTLKSWKRTITVGLCLITLGAITTTILSDTIKTIAALSHQIVGLD